MTDALRKLAALRGRRPVTVQTEVGEPSRSIDAVLARKAKRSRPPDQADMRRICRLDVIWPLTETEVLEITRANVLASAFDDPRLGNGERGFRLFPVQALALTCWDDYAGLFGPIGVGHGKTLIDLMLAYREFKRGGTPMVLVPPQVLDQFVSIDIPWARRRVPLGMPFHVLGGLSADRREALARSGRRGCYVVPYSLLSVPDTENLLGWIRPTAIIADEVQALRNQGRARTDRALRYIDKHRPRLAVLSGTMTTKGVEDYHHLARRALGDHCFLPTSPVLAENWGLVLNSDAAPSSTQTGPLRPLLEWAERHFPDDEFPGTVSGFRAAYRRRLETAPGVAATGDAEVGVELYLKNEKVEGQAERLHDLMRQVRDEYVTPDGDEIDYAIHTHKWLFELTSGAYYSLVWPSPEELAKRRNIPAPAASSLLARAREHHEASQRYHKELRYWLSVNAVPGCDTPMLVGNSIKHHGAEVVGTKLARLWTERRALEFEGMPERDSRVVRVCPRKIEAAVKWAQDLPRGEGALVWFHHKAVGQWTHELMQAAGLDVVYCPAGTEHNKRVRDEANVDKIVVASITAHGTGKNLQHHANNYFLQWPRNAGVAEQVLGRTHRTGQQRDELTMWRCDSNEFDELNFASCLNDAAYMQQTTGAPHRLLYAHYDPWPTVFSPEWLNARGMDVLELNKAQRDMLTERFGSWQDRVG